MRTLLCISTLALAGFATNGKIIETGKNSFVFKLATTDNDLAWTTLKADAQKSATNFCTRLGKRVGAPEIEQIDPADWEKDRLGIRFNCIEVMSGTPPIDAPFGDAKYYVLVAPIRYKLGTKKLPVVVPRGFITDLTSVPQPLWSVLPRDGQYLSAAILHDYMYWDQRCSKDQADLILKVEMEDFGVAGFDRVAVYQAVKNGGGGAWQENTNNKKTRIRVMPEPHLTSFLESDLDASRTWKTIHSELRAAGVSPAPDMGNPNIVNICREVTTGLK